jgi:hypothetical protein
MEISSIPEYVEVDTGDVIRAEHWNSVQRQTRSSLRKHKHTHVATRPRNDAATTDEADQISTEEIADVAVTAAKIAGSSVGTNHLQDSAVTSPKLAFELFAKGTLEVPHQESEVRPLKLGISSIERVTYFPTVAITSTSVSTGPTPIGFSSIRTDIIYRQVTGFPNFGVYISLTNLGDADATVDWEVWIITS